MNNRFVPQDVSKTKAGRRIGSCVTFVVLLFGFLCLASIWIAFTAKDLNILKTSWHLQFNGERTTGEIVDFDVVPGNRPGTTSRYLIVEYLVDDEAYTVRSLTAYGGASNYQLGDVLDVLYDPQDPASSQLDLFLERWLSPFVSILPF